MDDKVLREVTVLIRDCSRMAETLRCLRQALRGDSRFARLEPVKEMTQSSFDETIRRTGPEDLTDPFSVPLAEDHD